MSTGGRPQIDLVGHEQTADFFTVIDQQANANIGLDLAKFGEQPGGEVLGGTRHGDSYAAALEAFQGHQGLIGILQRLQDLPGMIEQNLAGFRQEYPLSDAIE